MESSLSPALANIFMDQFINPVFNKTNYKDKNLFMYIETLLNSGNMGGTYLTNFNAEW